MKSIFSKIIDKEIPAYIIEENAKHIAFLDVNPLTKGHLLIVPKKQIDYLFDLNTEDYVDLHLFAKRIAKALKNTIPCLRIGSAVVGLEVPHVHIHLIPLNHLNDINFSNKRLSFTSQEYQEIAQNIKNNL